MEKSEKIKQFRLNKGLTQSGIADELGIIKQSYSMIELGKNALKIEHLEKLIEMGLNPMWFFLDRGEMVLGEATVSSFDKYLKKPILTQVVGDGGNNNHNTVNIGTLSDCEKEKKHLQELLVEKEKALQEKERTIQILLNQK